MNKLFLPLLTVLVLLASCGKDSDPEIYLKSVTSYMTPYENGEPQPAARFKWGSENYTHQGLLYKKEYRVSVRPQEMYNSLHWEIYSYQNGLLHHTSFYHTPNQVGSNGFYQRYEYVYTSGKLSVMNTYNEAGLFETYTYSYNGGDKPARMEITYQRSDVPSDTRRIYTYSYDERGNLVKEELRTGDFHTKITQWEYDARGNLTKRSHVDSWDATIYTVETYNYRYDTKGRIAEREFAKNGMQRFQKWIYHYDDSSQEHPDRIQSIDVFEETAPGNQIYEQVGVIHYEYEYGTI